MDYGIIIINGFGEENITSMALAPSLMKMCISISLLQWRRILEIWFHKSEVVYHLYLHSKILLLTFCIFENWRKLINLGLPFLGKIVPGNSYPPSRIREAVYQVTHIRPTLHCFSFRRFQILLEIRFCAYGNGQLFDCIDDSNCRKSVVFLPLPQPLWHGP